MSEHNYVKAEAELNSEPVLSPEEIEKHNKKVLRKVTIDIIVCLVIGAIGLAVFYFLLESRFVETLLTRGISGVIFIPMLVIFLTFSIIYHLIEYKTLKKASLYEKIERFKIQNKWNIISRVALTVLVLVVFFLAARADWNFTGTYDIDAMNKLNFPTATEVFSQKDGDVAERSQTHMIVRDNFIAPTIHQFYQWLGATRVRFPTDASFLYHVYYYELHNEWLAARYERELRRQIGESWAANVFIIEMIDKIEKDIQGFDSAIYYSYFFRVCFYEECEECEALGIRHFAENLILREGNTVITVRYEGPESLLDSINQGRLSR